MTNNIPELNSPTITIRKRSFILDLVSYIKSISSFDASIVRRQLSSDVSRFCSSVIMPLWLGLSKSTSGDKIDENWQLWVFFRKTAFDRPFGDRTCESSFLLYDLNSISDICGKCSGNFLSQTFLRSQFESNCNSLLGDGELLQSALDMKTVGRHAKKTPQIPST